MPFLTPNAAPARKICRRIFIPDDPEWLALVNGALSELIKEENWEKFGFLTPAAAAATAQRMVLDFMESGCMLGAIFPYITVNPPHGCLPCDGSYHLRADYPLLYDQLPASLIVDSYAFRTPDLRDRFVFGAGERPPLAVGGVWSVALTAEQNGRHSHATLPHTHVDVGHVHAVSNSPGITLSVAGPGELLALAPNLFLSYTLDASAALQPEEVVVLDSGEGEPHENMPPYIALKWCIVAK